ncbi:MAG: hypothetical protein ACR2F8_08305 [Caulobacteraceae bacterium]
MFAATQARGESPRRAWPEAGYASRPLRARRLAEKKDMIARVAELAEAAAWAGRDPQLARIYGELMRLAAKAGELGTGAAMVAERGLLAEAIALRERGAPAGGGADGGTAGASALPPILTKEEWLAAFAPRQP